MVDDAEEADLVKGQIKEMFRAYDTDKDGFIGRGELQVIFNKIGEWDAEDFELLFSESDQNGDSKLSYDEFLDWVMGAGMGECLDEGTDEASEWVAGVMEGAPPEPGIAIVEGDADVTAVAEQLAKEMGAGAACCVFTMEEGSALARIGIAGVRQSHSGSPAVQAREAMREICAGALSESYHRCQPGWMSEGDWINFWSPLGIVDVAEEKHSFGGHFAPALATHFVATGTGRLWHVQMCMGAEGNRMSGLMVVPLDRAVYDSLEPDGSLSFSADNLNKCEVGDKWHLGSCTKAITATLCAIFVESGELSWDTTVGVTLGDEVARAYSGVTLRQLLSHQSGFPEGDCPPAEWRLAWELHQSGRPAAEQRQDFAAAVLQVAPAREPGPPAAYSNQNYCIAARMLDVVAGQAWEDLVAERIFAPLQMHTAGLGPAGRYAGDVTCRGCQPWGHRGSNPALLTPCDPAIYNSDNPDAVGPAGMVHCSIADWMRFVAVHVDPKYAQRKLGLGVETLVELHSAVDGAEHACGWIVAPRSWAGGNAITHSGSNLLNSCTVWAAPAKGLAVMVACNTCPGGTQVSFGRMDGRIADLLALGGAEL